MVHPWMNGVVRVGNYPDSGSTSNAPITVILNDSEFYLDVPNQVVRAKVEMRDFSPSDGQYFMKVTHLSTSKIVKDSEIYPKAAGNDLYSVQVAHPLSESDIMVGGQALLGEYEIQIISEKGVHTGSAKFMILETLTEPQAELVSESKIVIDATADKRTYDENETIQVTGTVNDILYGDIISLRVLSPNGNVVSIDQSHIDSEGLFIYSLRTNNNLFTENGEFTIQLLYGTDEIQKDVLVSYIGHTPPKPDPIPVPKVESAPKVVESKPKVEQTAPKVVEKTVEKQTPLKQDEPNYDYTFILILAGIAIAGIVGGMVAIKKRSKGKEDSSTSSNTKSKLTESKEEMEWEGI